MGWLSKGLESSIGKKIIMSLTGILLLIYLVVHLFGNLFLYSGPEAFNGWAETLRSVPYILVIEAMLGLLFLLHIIYGVRVWIMNKKARPVGYKVNKPSEGSSFSSRTMIYSGSIVFIFLVIHLQSFWWPAFSAHGSGAEFSLYDNVVGAFSSWVYSLFYVVAIILLAFHLNHGFQSAFQTLGWNHKKYFGFIKGLGTLYTVIIALGFISMPIYFLFFYGGN